MNTEIATLTGSEKQIAWATTIRATALPKLQTEAKKIKKGLKIRLDDLQSMSNPSALVQREIEEIQADVNVGIDETYAAIYNITDSNFWITNRNENIVMLWAKAAAFAAKV